jgi:rhodanese-related sulfurtransferase
MKTMTVHELRERLDGASKPLVLDVRRDDEFARGHIEGALHIPLNELPQRLQELEPHRHAEIVVNCAVGGRSAKACQFLAGEGFSNVANLLGGFVEWQE